MLKGQEKIITSTMKKAYGLYFNREVAKLNKNYVPNYCCSYCLRYRLGWLKGAPISLKFAFPMIRKVKQHHEDDCQLCLAKVPSGINRSNKERLTFLI